MFVELYWNQTKYWWKFMLYWAAEMLRDCIYSSLVGNRGSGTLKFIGPLKVMFLLSSGMI